jgi:hypothetical protein
MKLAAGSVTRLKPCTGFFQHPRKIPTDFFLENLKFLKRLALVSDHDIPGTTMRVKPGLAQRNPIPRRRLEKRGGT